MVATGDVHFLNPEDEIYRRLLLASKGFEDCDRELPLYFPHHRTKCWRNSATWARKRPRRWSCTNPNLIADMCDQIRPVPHNLFAPIH